MAEGIDKQSLFDSLPPVWPEPLLPRIRARIAASKQRLVILDDDPTGGQTLHGLPVLAAWDTETLARELVKSPAFFVLTNSRALHEGEAVAIASAVGRNLRYAALRAGYGLVAAYRGDSTLRGHFPAETDALHLALTSSEEPPAYVFAPYFAEGGRFTIDDTQYVQQGDRLVPAAETEFARDPRFAYTHSRLPSWLAERSSGRISARDVVSVSIEDLRIGGPEAAAAKLRRVRPGGVAIVNAASDRDLEVVVAGLLDAEADGARFLYRSAASFVRVRAGIEPRPLLDAAELHTSSAAGLVLAGSYVDRTTEQLAALLASGTTGIELSVEAILGESGDEVGRVARGAESALVAGKHAVIYTSRPFVESATGLYSVAIGARITRAFCEILARLEQRPGFLVVKGGSTAHGVAAQGLGMKRAVVLGQLLPGVPVWRLGPESRYPDLPYVVFPGNVGGRDALVDALRTLRGCDAG